MILHHSKIDSLFIFYKSTFGTLEFDWIEAHARSAKIMKTEIDSGTSIQKTITSYKTDKGNMITGDGGVDLIGEYKFQTLANNLDKWSALLIREYLCVLVKYIRRETQEFFNRERVILVLEQYFFITISGKKI
ncbi:hypothetical protein GLOIN_2v1785301 [Rhizophagus clarus]|uniref:Uncharacterized protein n=1 Tax=Rhizophagus clarus TaxID=94130 RepID=A0A8H3MEF8_9GLOM|nr:hypothetical protein GLOIN_2v1785301 [Rhizophagus clarus]